MTGASDKIFRNLLKPLGAFGIKGGNYAEHLEKSSFLYAKLLCGQGKDLYLLGVESDWGYAIPMTKKERKSDEKGEILDADDVKDLLKMFPLNPDGINMLPSEINELYRIKPYTGENTKKHLTTRDLEIILDGQPVRMF